MMIFNKPFCPECGEQADGTFERMTGRGCLSFNEDGKSAEWEGTTEVFWDDQRTERDSRGRVNLLCHNGHGWFSKMKEVI